MLHSTCLEFWLLFICLWRGQLLTAIPPVGSTPVRGLTKSGTQASDISENLRGEQIIDNETQGISSSSSTSRTDGFGVFKSNKQRKTEHVSDPHARLMLSDILGNKRDSERMWKHPGPYIRSAFKSLKHKTLNFFSRIKEFLWGSDSESDSITKIRYGVPKEEDERKEIVQNFIGAVKPGTIAPAWFKNLETTFRTLPAITEWDGETESLLSNSVYALATQTLSLQQRAVILSAINHVTSYNPQAKQALIECANKEPLIFKTLALSIKDVRHNGLPDLSLKHSFEAEWLSTSPEVEERFFRMILVDPNGARLSDQVKRIGERLEHCQDVYTWSEVEKGTRIKDGEIKTIVNDAMELLKLLSDMEDKLYTYRIIRYIAMINQDAQEAWKKKLFEEDFRTTVVKILFVLYTDRLMDVIPSKSLERTLLFADAEVGPFLERTALKLYINTLHPPEHIRELANKVIAPDLHLNGFPPNPKDPKAAHVVLHQLLDLAAPEKEGEPRLSAWEKDLVIRLLAYLSRWNKYITRAIQESLNDNPHYLKFIATEVVKKYPDGAHETAPKFSFERDLLEPLYLAELFGRYELKLSNSKITAKDLSAASKSLHLLPNRWYEDPLAHEPQEIVRKLLTFVNNRSEKDEDYEAKTAIRMIQHFVYYQPSLKELVLVAIGPPRRKSLHFHLKKYCETAQHYSKRKGGYTSRFVDWLNEIPALKDSNKNINDQFTGFSLLPSTHVTRFIKQYFSGNH